MTGNHFDGNKCPKCKTFMRKEGEEWKCSRCEKKKVETPTVGEHLRISIDVDETVLTVKNENGSVEAFPILSPTEVLKVVKPKVATNPPATIETANEVANAIDAVATKEDKSIEIKKTLDESDFARLGGKMLAMGKAEDGSFLGYLLGYSIGDRLISHDVADKKMDKIGMPEDIRPSKSRERDAFKNACSLTEKEEEFSSPTLSKKYGTNAKFRAVYKADQVKPHEYIIDRKIFLVEDEKDGKKIKKSDIQFDRLARITLVIEDEDKPNEKCHIEAEPMSQGDEKTAMYLKGVIIDDWKVLMKSYTSKQIRDSLRKFVRQGDGIPYTVGRGGVWFMPKANNEENIKKWVEFCEWCDKQNANGSDNRVDLRIIPALDLYGMKGKIAQDVSDEVQQRVKNLLEDTYAKLKDEKNEEKIEMVLAKQLASKREDVDGLLSNYKKILKDEIGVTLKLDVARNEKVEGTLSPKAKQMLREIMRV